MALIQIRDVPEDVHRRLKVRAAAEGTSLSAYLLRIVTRAARAPTPEEIDARIRSREPAGVSTEEILAARDAGRRA
jgi:antitoxin FitA